MPSPHAYALIFLLADPCLGADGALCCLEIAAGVLGVEAAAGLEASMRICLSGRAWKSGRATELAVLRKTPCTI